MATYEDTMRDLHASTAKQFFRQQMDILYDIYSRNPSATGWNALLVTMLAHQTAHYCDKNILADIVTQCSLSVWQSTLFQMCEIDPSKVLGE